MGFKKKIERDYFLKHIKGKEIGNLSSRELEFFVRLRLGQNPIFDKDNNNFLHQQPHKKLSFHGNLDKSIYTLSLFSDLNILGGKEDENHCFIYQAYKGSLGIKSSPFLFSGLDNELDKYSFDVNEFNGWGTVEIIKDLLIKNSYSNKIKEHIIPIQYSNYDYIQNYANIVISPEARYYLDNIDAKKIIYEAIESGEKFISTDIINKILDNKKGLQFNKINFSKKLNHSKTIYYIIEEAAQEEGIEISAYIREKIAQVIIEITQDAFKDFSQRTNSINTDNLDDFIERSLKRQREYKRWSEREDRDLYYLWKKRCFNPAKIARLMQRSIVSVETRIDFIESTKYMNRDNFEKEIKTKGKI